MADQVFVDPITGLTLGPHAFGVVPAGTASAEFEAEHRYRWGLTGAGHYQTAYVLYTSTDGGLTWSTTSTEFTLQIIEPLNPGSDPLFLGQATAETPTSRLDVAPLRSGCGNLIGIKFQPSLRTGAARETINWKLGVLFNETFQTISLNPDAPSGVLSGRGDVSVSEWAIAPTLTLGTDEVTLGDCEGVVTGQLVARAGGTVALDQTSSTGALTAGQEYIALLSIDTFGDITTTKGARATAGSAVQPAFPTGELPIAVVRVPYGGVIATGTLVAVSGQCWVAAGAGLTVTIQPGRAMMPGFYLTPGVVQTLTMPYSATTRVYLSGQGVANTVSGVTLADVTTSGGAVTDVQDVRTMLYQGLRPKLYTGLDADGHAIGNLPHPTTADDPANAATWRSVLVLPAKNSARLVATVPATWPNVVTNGTFTTDLTGWTGTNWAQSAGTALHAAGAVNPLAYAVEIVSGLRYRITVTVTGAAGTVTPMIGADAGTAITAGAGAVTQEVLSTAGGALSVSFVPTTDFDGSLDDVLVETLLYGLPDDVDSVAVADTDVLLLAGEIDDTLTGKWIVYDAAGWTRHPDCRDADYVYPGVFLWVTEGTAQVNSDWVQYGTFAAQVWVKRYQVP